MKKPDSMEFSFSSLENTDRIVVTTNLNQTITTVYDLETIRTVLAFVKGHKQGWTVPRGGVPIAMLRLNFYQGGRPLDNVGVGETFLSAHQHGGFYAKKSNEEEHAKLLDILGLETDGDVR